MTENDPSLDAAYSLNGPDDSRRLYSDWAETYDSQFIQGHGYVLADRVAQALADAGGQGPVLDVGGGTGRVAERLTGLGIGPVDGLDLSPEMLEVAKARGLYRRTFVADVTAPLLPEIDGYGAVVSAGTFTLGHVGPEALPQLLGRLRPGGHMVISVHTGHWADKGFAAAFDAFGPRLTALNVTEARIYAEDADGPHAGDMAKIVVARL